MDYHMRITGKEVQEIVFPLTKHGYSPPKIVGVVSIDEGISQYNPFASYFS
jgi:hypothetical protein